MSALAWPLVALAYALVLWRFLESYLRGLRSERQVLAAASDELRAKIKALEGDGLEKAKYTVFLEKRLVAIEDNLRNLEQRTPSPRLAR